MVYIAYSSPIPSLHHSTSLSIPCQNNHSLQGSIATKETKTTLPERPPPCQPLLLTSAESASERFNREERESLEKERQDKKALVESLQADTDEIDRRYRYINEYQLTPKELKIVKVFAPNPSP